MLRRGRAALEAAERANARLKAKHDHPVADPDDDEPERAALVLDALRGVEPLTALQLGYRDCQLLLRLLDDRPT